MHTKINIYVFIDKHHLPLCFLVFFQSMISSACIEHLDFLDSIGDVFTRFEEKNVTQSFKSLTEIPKLPELVDDGINVREEVLMILFKFHLNMFLVEKSFRRFTLVNMLTDTCFSNVYRF